MMANLEPKRISFRPHFHRTSVSVKAGIQELKNQASPVRTLPCRQQEPSSPTNVDQRPDGLLAAVLRP